MKKLWPKEDRKMHKIKKKDFPDFWNYFPKENPRKSTRAADWAATSAEGVTRCHTALRWRHGGSHVAQWSSANGGAAVAGEGTSGKRSSQRTRSSRSRGRGGTGRLAATAKSGGGDGSTVTVGFRWRSRDGEARTGCALARRCRRRWRRRRRSLDGGGGCGGGKLGGGEENSNRGEPGGREGKR